MVLPLHLPGAFQVSLIKYSSISKWYVIFAITVAHAAYFSVYETMKVLVGANREGHHPIGAALSGASAAFSHDLFMTPLDTVKQRMQLGYYRNNFHCIKTILKEEGIKSFYRSFPTTVIMNLPYGCIMVATNESVKEFFHSKNDDYNFVASMVAGSVAGSVAAALTNPLDVIKTRLQTHNLQPCPIASTNSNQNIPKFETIISNQTVGTSTKVYSSRIPNISKGLGEPIITSISQVSPIFKEGYSSLRSPIHWHSTIVDTVKGILREDGYQGFLRGIGPRVLVHAPSVAISWTVYEGLKHLFSSNS